MNVIIHWFNMYGISEFLLKLPTWIMTIVFLAEDGFYQHTDLCI